MRNGGESIVTIYKILVFIHIVSAILGMGPGFVLSLIPKTAKTMDELRNAYIIKHQVHLFTMYGGMGLLFSGLGMGMLNPGLFTMWWYNISLLLFLIGLAMGPFVLAPISKKIKYILATHKEVAIPKEYRRLVKKLDFYEGIGLVVFSMIIILIITKPF